MITIFEYYFDNSATTKPYDEVCDLIDYQNRNIYGNPSSLHKLGLNSEKLIKLSREQISHVLSSDTSEIIFNSGGSEGNNHCIRGYLEANPRKGKHIITSTIEHPSVLEVFHYLEKNGYQVSYVDVDSNGRINEEQLLALIKADTALVSFSPINNETGVIQNYTLLPSKLKKKNQDLVIHCDSVQTFGKIQINPKKLNIDMLTLSSHKIHGPKGCGAIFKQKGIRISPLIIGGGQEENLRSGTENISGICGFGLAAEMSEKNLIERQARANDIKKLFCNMVMQEVSDVYENVERELTSPFILSLAFEGIRSEILLHYLEDKGIFVSTGSACSSRSKHQSHVLKAMGLKDTRIDGTIRFSFGYFNCIEQVDYLVEAIKDSVSKIRRTTKHK